MKPNILWICTDQQRKDTLGCYGNSFVHTPNIDGLANGGIRFENMYSQSPVCAPSRASFLTGRYPRTCRVRQNGQDIPTEEVTFPKILSQNGYVCGLAGKLHISACHPEVCKFSERRIDDGYSYFKWSHHPAGRKDKNNWRGNEYCTWLADNGLDYASEPLADCKYVRAGMPYEYSHTKWCTDRAIEFMEERRSSDKPWMFSLNYFDPHHAFDPSYEFLEPYLSQIDNLPLPDYKVGELAAKPCFQLKDSYGAYDTKGYFPFNEMTEQDHRLIKAAYYAMCDQIDFGVGKILSYLEKSGLRESTLIIYMADHGESLGDHGIYLKGPYFYDSCVNVPFIISFPSKFSGNRVSGALAELVDVVPTLCEIAEIPCPRGVQGKSFYSLLTGEKETHRSTVYTEYYNANINHRNPFAYCTMVRDNRYKLVKVHPRDTELSVTGELYDLKNDAGEHENLYDCSSYREVKLRMLEKLCDRMAQTADPLPQRRSVW